MIQPIRNNVLVECIDMGSVTEGGLVVPDSVKKDANKVRIVAVGNGTAKRPMKLKPGLVGFRVKDWGEEVWEDDKKYFLMDDKAIIALQ
jgi:co-chaperonin GroES (HSP10)